MTKTQNQKPGVPLTIVPVNRPGSGRTGTLRNITVAQINKVLGFKPNCEDDPDKVKHSWGFFANGQHCGVWDYKGSQKWKQFSTDGPDEVMKKLFGANYSK